LRLPRAEPSPGSPQWNNWYQSRSPRDPQGDQQGNNKPDYIAFDYDMVFITSLPVSQAAAGDDKLEAMAAHYLKHITHSRKQEPVLAASPPAAKTSPSAGCDCSCLPKAKAGKRR